MKYSKPEITLLASASSVIQGTTHPKASNPTDGQVLDENIATPAAYEADE
jgi:hypothetical protein